MAAAGQPPRSLFVTNLAWLVISIGGIATAGALLNLALSFAMLAIPLPTPPGRSATAATGAASAIVVVFHVLYLASAGLLLWAGLGLLRRRNWARRVILGFLFAGVAAALLFVLLVLLFAVAALLEVKALDLLGILLGAVGVVALLAGSGGAAALQWWVARRLRQPEVLREFVTGPHPAP